MSRAEDTTAEQALAAERDATIALVASLSARLEEVLDATRDTAADDEHDPEGSTLAVERGQLVAQLHRSRERLEELDVACARLEHGSYGICETCGERIAAVRLEVLPAARLCIGCASHSSRGRW